MDQINWIAAVVAGVLGFFPGALWYSNLMFLKPWQADMGISGNEAGGISMATRLVSGVILSIIAAVAFAFLLGPHPAVHPSLLKAVVVALAIITTSFGIQYLFEGRTVRVTAINGGYHLVQFLIFAVVLGLWH
jgi:hypothetical protein